MKSSESIRASNQIREALSSLQPQGVSPMLWHLTTQMKVLRGQTIGAAKQLRAVKICKQSFSRAIHLPYDRHLLITDALQRALRVKNTCSCSLAQHIGEAIESKPDNIELLGYFHHWFGRAIHSDDEKKPCLEPCLRCGFGLQPDKLHAKLFETKLEAILQFSPSFEVLCSGRAPTWPV